MGCGASTARKVDPVVEEKVAEVKEEPAAAEPAPPATAAVTPEAAPTTRSEAPKLSERVKWRKGDLIGAGANGRVYLGLEEETGAIIAVKEIVFSNGSEDREELERIQEEIELLRTLQHPNIVTYLGTDVDDEKQTLYIFTEWVPGGSIQALVTKFGRLPEAIVRKYVAQLLVGLQYLHERQVIHRDIKPANILVDDRGTIKLADFGSSKRMDSLGTQSNEGLNSLRGTPFFMAPEVITQTGHGRKADIWSVGCTIVQMVTGQPPWKSLQLATPAALMFHIANANDPPPMPSQLSPELRSMLLLCFSRDVDKRPTADELLQHPFMVANNAANEAIEAGGAPVTVPSTGSMSGKVLVIPDASQPHETREAIEKAADQTIADELATATPVANERLLDSFSIVVPATKGATARSSSSSARVVPEVPPATPPSPLPPQREAADNSDEMLITTFISKEAAAQFAGADKHFPGRPPTARPKGAPPPRTAGSSHGRRRPSHHDDNMTTWHSRPTRKSSGRGLKSDEKSPLLMADKPQRGTPKALAATGSGSRSHDVWRHRNSHDDRPIVTEAARREIAAEIKQEKARAELTEHRVRKNEQFQAELDRFKATMQLTNGDPAQPPAHRGV